jgi:drug/metabolite transporter (DMT)-like permease
MIYLLLSILLSASLFIFFKWFDLRKVNLIPAICGNYIACICTGFMIGDINYALLSDFKYLSACVALGILFFLIFYAMGFASARIGVGISSASAKLSLMIPVIYGSLALGEELKILHILAVIIVIPAVLLMSYKKGEALNKRNIGIPLIIFLGSGIIDTALNLLANTGNTGSSDTGIIVIFSTALLCVLSYMKLKDLQVLKERRSIMYGFILGIPNYFSVYFLMLALNSGALKSGQFYLINNTGVMLVSYTAARLIFKEQIDRMKLSGITLACIAIYLVLFG